MLQARKVIIVVRHIFNTKKTKISSAMLLKSKFKKYSCESDTGSGLKARLKGTVKENLKGVLDET